MGKLMQILICYIWLTPKKMVHVETTYMEKKQIPDDINYDDVANLRKEARQKLSNIRPTSLGQASRISGVSPADVSVLMIYLETKKQA